MSHDHNPPSLFCSTQLTVGRWTLMTPTRGRTGAGSTTTTCPTSSRRCSTSSAQTPAWLGPTEARVHACVPLSRSVVVHSVKTWPKRVETQRTARSGSATSLRQIIGLHSASARGLVWGGGNVPSECKGQRGSDNPARSRLSPPPPLCSFFHCCCFFYYYYFSLEILVESSAARGRLSAMSGLQQRRPAEGGTRVDELR